MKQISLLFLALLILSSCSKSTEEKVNSLIKDEMNKTLVKIDSYDPVETLIDSAYTPYDDPSFLNTLKDISGDLQSFHMMEIEADLAKSSMDIYEDLKSSSYLRNQDLKHKEEYEEQSAKMKELQSNWEKKLLPFKPMFDKKPEFIGYKIRHKYRYENNDGKTVFGNMYFIVDKDLKKVLVSCDMESIEFAVIEQGTREIKKQRGEE